VPRAKERQVGGENRRPADGAVDGQVAADCLGAVTQPLEPGGVLERCAAGTVVGHGDAKLLATARHFNVDLIRACVLDGVRRRLSGDEVGS
jgi:hypothetical protein